MQPTKEYYRGIELSRELNRGGKFNSGAFLLFQTKRIKAIIDRLGIKTALDYGCGRGRQYEKKLKDDGRTLEQYWGITIDKYDPGFPEFEKEPTGTYDMVISTHALGLIPVPDLEWVVPRIFALSRKAVFVALLTGTPTRKPQKARYRVDSIPPPWWGAKEWLALFKRHLPQDRPLEVHFVVRKKDRAAHYLMHGPEGRVEVLERRGAFA